MPKKRTSCFRIFLVSLLTLLCLGLVGGVGLAVYLPERAAQTFGPPVAEVDPIQRIILSARLLWWAQELEQPYDPLGEEKPFRIELGEAPWAIAGRLEDQGLIPDGEAFRVYLIYSGLDKTIQAGEYSLNPASSPIQIAQALQDATPKEVTFNILSGWRLEEIAASLPTSGLAITPEAFLAAAADPPVGYAFLQDLPPEATLEGFLPPGTYRLPRDLTIAGLMARLLDSFQSQLQAEIRQGFERQGLNLFEAITLASIVERETIVDDEMPLIASVFLNRLQAGIKLDSDPTVQYALGFDSDRNTWWTNPLTEPDLAIDSPYNTYRYAGLPPGPIANPSLAALRAVAFPAQTPYYYFRAACDGSGKHTFSETYQEHIEAGCP